MMLTRVLATLPLLALLAAAAAAGQPAGPRTTNDLYGFLFQALGKKPPELPRPLSFGRAEAIDAEIFVKKLGLGEFEKQQDTLDPRYSYVRFDFGQCGLLYRFGYPEDEWKDRLFSASFTLISSEEELAALAQAVRGAYGQPSRVESLFMGNEQSGKRRVSVQVWNRPNAVVTFHQDAAEDWASATLELWDPQFLSTRDRGYYCE